MIYALLMCKNGDTSILEFPSSYPLEVRRPKPVKRDFSTYWTTVTHESFDETQRFRGMKDSEYKIVYYLEV